MQWFGKKQSYQVSTFELVVKQNEKKTKQKNGVLTEAIVLRNPKFSYFGRDCKDFSLLILQDSFFTKLFSLFLLIFT